MQVVHCYAAFSIAILLQKGLVEILGVILVFFPKKRRIIILGNSIKQTYQHLALYIWNTFWKSIHFKIGNTEAQNLQFKRNSTAKNMKVMQNRVLKKMSMIYGKVKLVCVSSC